MMRKNNCSSSMRTIWNIGAKVVILSTKQISKLRGSAYSIVIVSTSFPSLLDPTHARRLWGNSKESLKLKWRRTLKDTLWGLMTVLPKARKYSKETLKQSRKLVTSRLQRFEIYWTSWFLQLKKLWRKILTSEKINSIRIPSQKLTYLKTICGSFWLRTRHSILKLSKQLLRSKALLCSPQIRCSPQRIWDTLLARFAKSSRSESTWSRMVIRWTTWAFLMLIFLT